MLLWRSVQHLIALLLSLRPHTVEPHATLVNHVSEPYCTVLQRIRIMKVATNFSVPYFVLYCAELWSWKYCSELGSWKSQQTLVNHRAGESDRYARILHHRNMVDGVGLCACRYGAMRNCACWCHFTVLREPNFDLQQRHSRNTRIISNLF